MGLPASQHVVGIALRDDELEIFANASDGVEQDLFRGERRGVGAPFTMSPTPLSVTAAGYTEASPWLSDDGLELLFSSNREGPFSIYRSRRGDRGAEFVGTERLVLPGTEGMDVDSPRLSLDGRTLFFRTIVSAEDEPMLARRESPDVVEFDRSTRMADLASTLGDYHLTPAEWTGEMFFVSNRDWSPGTSTIWRARLCRAGACPPLQIDCEPPATRSAGGHHCYERSEDSLPWTAAHDACEARGGSLVTVHSAAETDAATLGEAGPVWVGARDGSGDAFVWVTGEPPPRSGFPLSTPGVPECLSIEGRSFVARNCDEPHEYTCERESWPAW
jgi:hypothetical protein